MKTEPTEARCHIMTRSIGDGYGDEIMLREDAEEAVNIAFKEGQSSPKIKQLEWEDADVWYFKSKTSFRLWYSITEIRGTYIIHFGDAPISWKKSLESAKAAAQDDFEQRVKECLL